MECGGVDSEGGDVIEVGMSDQVSRHKLANNPKAIGASTFMREA